MQIVNGLKYAKSHEWVKVEGNKALVGITDYAQGHLGEIVFLELPELGMEVSSGDQFAVVESVKAASDVYAPVSGTVTEINEDLMDNPGQINQEAFESWFVSIEISDPGQLEELLDAAQYEKLCTEED